jgi:tetratricopeptide (TPR) repeat protein
MWHLIIPPIVIVVSLALLVRYLSRKIADPKVSEKVDVAMGGVESHAIARSLSRTDFFLKLSERMLSIFKVLSLRIHNFFQHSSEHLREKRKKVREMKRIAENVSSSAKGRLTSLSKPSFSSWWKSNQSAVPDVAEREITPVFPGTEPVSESLLKRQSFARAATNTGTADRPREEKWKEDDCIKRIAENPKDIDAYESLGDYYFSIESMEDAKACYRQALKLQPTNRIIKIKIRKLEKFFEKGN